jgi:hypothetical protein
MWLIHVPHALTQRSTPKPHNAYRIPHTADRRPHTADRRPDRRYPIVELKNTEIPKYRNTEIPKHLSIHRRCYTLLVTQPPRRLDAHLSQLAASLQTVTDTT